MHVPRRWSVVALAAVTLGAATTRPATRPTTHPTTHPIATADDPRVGAELSAVIGTLTPRVGPTGLAAVFRYRRQAAADADTVLAAGGLDLGPKRRRGQPFDDDANRAYIRQAIRMSHDFKMEVPPATRALEEQDATQPLTGPRLELLADLEEGEVTLLFKAVSAEPVRAKR